MPSWHPAATHFARLSELLAAPERRLALLDPEQPFPPEVIDYFGRLYVLKGVPFNYLVPDARMLPEESIRFFYLDPNWLNALIDGAMSVGRITSNDAQQDTHVKATALEQAVAQVANFRAQANGGVPAQINTNTTWSGFLLRSQVVAGWPGLEVDAYQDVARTTRLNILRMERLSSTVLLCIFDGIYQCLDLHEPKEGIHFGADYEPRTDTYKKTELRGLGMNGHAIGQVPATAENVQVVVPTRSSRGVNLRVVNLAEFAKNTLTPALVRYNIVPPSFELTAAEFSLEMVESPYLESFETSEPARTTAAVTPSFRVMEALVTEPEPLGPLAADRKRLAAYLFGGHRQ